MDLIAFLIAPPIIAFIFLATFPANHSFLGALAVFALVWGLAAASIFPIGPPSGPDDWFHGIETVPLFGSLAAAVFCVIAQGIRWWRIKQGKKPYYIVILIVLGIITFIASATIGAF